MEALKLESTGKARKRYFPSKHNGWKMCNHEKKTIRTVSNCHRKNMAAFPSFFQTTSLPYVHQVTGKSS